MHKPLVNIHLHQRTNKEDIEIVNLFPSKETAKEIKTATNSFFSIGIHPCFITEEKIEEEIGIIHQLAKEKQVLAIGEIGLDKLSKTSFETQKIVFIKQLEIAQETNKPVIIHSVKTSHKILQIKKELNFEIDFIFHGYRKNKELALQLIKNKCYLSFGEKFNPEAVIATPLEYLLIETDESESKLLDTYLKIAQLKESTIEELSKKILINFNTVFNQKYKPLQHNQLQ